jgi:metal-dependent HD superfamily phosphatase/phosphodiesterase
MEKSKSSTSGATTYKEIGSFWDTHSLSDFWGQTRKVAIDVEIESEITYYSVDRRLSEKVQSLAQRRGVSADTLINLWVQEKLQEQNP